MDEEPIDLGSIEKNNSSDLDRKLYHIFKNVLLSDSLTTPAESASQINELLSVENSRPVNTSETDENSRPTNTSESDAIEGFLWNLWGLLIEIVRLVPYRHAGQEKLILMLEALSRLPPTTIEIWGAKTRVWTDLPILGPCMRDNWAQPTYGGGVPDDDSAQHWLNLNSFAARLLNTGLTQWTHFAIWELSAALEQPTRARPIMNCDVAVAAEWILQGGEALHRGISEEVTEDEARSTKPGILYPGKAGLCRERWEFWKARFLEVSKQVDENIGKRAVCAAEKMKEIEAVRN